MKYFDIYMETDHEEKTGYSVFIQAFDENDAVERMTDQHLYEDAEDLNNIKAVSEITKEDYEAGVDRRWEEVESKLPKEFGVALKEKPLDEGLTRAEVTDLFDMLSGVDVIPIEITGDYSTAMGFISLTDAEWMDYDYSKLEDVVKNILNDMNNENESAVYECPNKNGVTTIWLSR